jgi:plasmid stabilization system protein ParE
MHFINLQRTVLQMMQTCWCKEFLVEARGFLLAGRNVAEYDCADVREVIHASYQIIYRGMFDEVHILVVQHGAKQLPDPLPI